MSRRKILKKGPGNALHVEAPVVEKSRILCSHKSLNDHLGHILIFDNFPVFQKEFIDEFVMIIVDPGGNTGTIVLKCGHRRQLFQQHIIEKTAGGNRQKDKGQQQDDHDGPQTGMTEELSVEWILKRSFQEIHAPSSPGTLFFFSANFAT